VFDTLAHTSPRTKSPSTVGHSLGHGKDDLPRGGRGERGAGADSVAPASLRLVKGAVRFEEQAPGGGRRRRLVCTDTEAGGDLDGAAVRQGDGRSSECFADAFSRLQGTGQIARREYDYELLTAIARHQIGVADVVTKAGRNFPED